MGLKDAIFGQDLSEFETEAIVLPFASALTPSNQLQAVAGDEGKVVSLNPAASGAVTIGAAGTPFFGVVDHIENGTKDAAVACRNAVRRVTYTGTDPSVGEKKELFSNGSGGLTVTGTAGAGRVVDVLAVDTVGKKVTILF